MKPLNIALGLLPVLLVAIGMITWVVTLRADLTATQSDIAAMRASQDDIRGTGERLVAVETHVGNLPDTTAWRNDVAERVVALESVPPLSVEAYDDSWLITRMDEYAGIIESLRDRELDTGMADKLSDLSREVSTVAAKVESLDISDYGDISARLGGMEAIISTIDGGEIDLSPLVTRIAELEGSLNALSDYGSQLRDIQGDLASLRTQAIAGGAYDDTTIRRQIATIQGSVSSLESTVRHLPSGTSYDDSSIRRIISGVENSLRSLEGQVNRLPTSSGTSYNDAPLRASVSSLQTSIATLQSQFNSQPVATNYATQITALGNKIDDLDYAVSNLPTTGGIDYGADIQALRNELGWLNDGLGDTFNYIFEELQRIESSNTSSGGSNITSTPEKLYVTHSNSGQYTGNYIHQGSFNGWPMWVCDECGPASGQFATAYLYRHEVGFTNSGWVWVVQPIPPSTQWNANAYFDAEWPWDTGTWDGNVQSVTIS